MSGCQRVDNADMAASFCRGREPTSSCHPHWSADLSDADHLSKQELQADTDIVL